MYVLEQSLAARVPAIYDVNLNQRRHRDTLTEVAVRHDANCYLLWFQIPLELALERAEQRRLAATGELRTYYDGF
jgi:predicted kinase